MPASDSTAPQLPGSGVNSSFRAARTIFALVLREMSSRYGRSPGGYLWAILEPLGGIAVLTFAMSFLLHTPSLGNSFTLFYATGYLSFSLYQSISNAVARSLFFSKPLMQYPAVTWADAVLARFFLNGLTGIFVGYIVLSGILMAIDTHVMLDIIPLLKAIGLTLLLGLSIGMLNCVLMGLINAWDLIWSIVSRPLFLASCVLLTYEDTPAFAQDILWYNPLVHIAGLMREAFYSNYKPTYVSELYVICLSLIVLFLGTVLLNRYHRHILNR